MISITCDKCGQPAESRIELKTYVLSSLMCGLDLEGLDYIAATITKDLCRYCCDQAHKMLTDWAQEKV